MNKILPIELAPRDGSDIIGIYRDGTEEVMHWNTDRYCMLGRCNGSFPDGWSSSNPEVDSNLPLDDKEIFAFKELTDEEQIQKLKNHNIRLIEALQYLVDTKKRKDTIGKDSIYMQRQRVAWDKARKALLGKEVKHES